MTIWRAALVTTAAIALIAAAFTHRYDGLWLIGLIAAIALLKSLGLFAVETWTREAPPSARR
ncbi:hypothetical protein [Microbacterium excoecariae]|uniref:hypothetical protein n=1 Tax=Microbacterium excoecariae TaxID=2715210 RepID=UPI00140BEBE3|nr:hypothetical protein [Microbacterium excoecariae]NHI16832.1 hypothetical protein [Microbacterium excoecariae]